MLDVQTPYRSSVASAGSLHSIKKRNMDKEKLIRSEASDLSKNLEKTIRDELGHKLFRDIFKNELLNLYDPHSKMVFLDELKNMVQINLNSHKETCPKTANGEVCPRDIKSEKILFYIEQEINELPLIIKANSTDSNKNKVFISYSHKDQEWLNMLKRHFKPFEKSIKFWDDSRIKPGTKWKEEIQNAIEDSKIAILMISADFFNSDFITSEEIPPLLEKAKREGTTILSVILKPCMFHEYPDISDYQAINSPNNTIIQMSEAERELIWVELVSTIKTILKM